MSAGDSRGIKILEQLVETQLKNAGFKNPAVVQIAISNGSMGLYVNYSDAVYSPTDAAIFVRFTSANAGFAAIAQRDLVGGIVAGPYSAEVICFAAAQDGSTPALDKLIMNTVEALNRNNIPVSLKKADPAGPVPALAGLNGASVDANIPAALGIFQEAPLGSMGA